MLGVDVVNLNDLANSLKPRYLPGERMVIKIIKAGESPGQGVGYLDDGTMVVVEDGYPHIGKDTEIAVKSVLQSSAGRMIFGRLPGPGTGEGGRSVFLRIARFSVRRTRRAGGRLVIAKGRRGGELSGRSCRTESRARSAALPEGVARPATYAKSHSPVGA